MRSFFRNQKLRHIFLLGLSSGLPFLLTLATLHVRLLEAGAQNATLGLFTLITLPYTVKFLWAGAVDCVSIKFLCTKLGQRRGWLLFCQLGLMGSIALLAFADPKISLWLPAGAGLLVALFSATQDLVYEAYRIEILNDGDFGAGAMASTLGYRVGIWISGACALYLAEYFGWEVSFCAMAACIVIGLITTLIADEPPTLNALPKLQMSASIKELIKSPSLTFAIAYIFFFKLGDTALNVMTTPFLLDLGFSKAEIAHVLKTFGIGTMVIGSIIGAHWLKERPLQFTLMLCSLLQALSCLLLCCQAYLGYDMGFLIIVVALENLTCGIGTAGLITFMSQLCRSPFTATHYALLSSFASMCRILISNLLGHLADRWSWENFYGIMALLCLPSFILLMFYSRQLWFDKMSATAPPKH
jgi:PAT family beta-lactamase induction signal transducer AmpG